MTISIALPWPPTSNTYWRRRGHVYFVTKKGIDYRNNTIYACLNYRNYFKEDERLKISIEAFPPDKRRRDLDNILKCLLDSLQHAQVYKDDSQIDELHIYRRHSGFGEVIVSLEKII